MKYLTVIVLLFPLGLLGQISEKDKVILKDDVLIIFWNKVNDPIPKYAITHLDSLIDLSKNSEVLETHYLCIQGHNDEDPQPHQSMIPSKIKAKQFMDFLEERGVPRTRMIGESFGAERAISNHKSLNRRIEIFFVEKEEFEKWVNNFKHLVD